MKTSRVFLAVVVVAAGAIALGDAATLRASAGSVSLATSEWASCGTQYDRLKTNQLDLTGDLKAGATVTIVASGETQLHELLVSGSWQIRVYEMGQAHEVYTTFGDLTTAIKFNDPVAPTSFAMKVSFVLPAPSTTGRFTASLTGTDQAKATYFCLHITYALPMSSAATPTIVETLAVAAPAADECTARDPASYCKYWQNPPVCQGSDIPCGACGPDSYCKYWLSPPVCQGSNIPCARLPPPPPPASSCGPDSYCKYWLDEPVCYGTNIPCMETLARGQQLTAANAECGVDSYCKYWQTPPVCQGTNAKCGDKCGPGSYCKYWQMPAVCQGTNAPCA